MRNKGPYTVVCLDKEGFTLQEWEWDTLPDANRAAKRMLTDPDYIGDVGKSEVRNAAGECIADYFAD